METLDILYIVIAFAVLWVTVFVCWFIFQVAMMIKRVNDVLRDMNEVLGRVEMALNGMKQKFERGGEHLGSMADHVKQAVSNWGKK